MVLNGNLDSTTMNSIQIILIVKLSVIYNILIKYNSIFNIYTLKNAGLNTAQCWVNAGLFFNQQLC